MTSDAAPAEAVRITGGEIVVTGRFNPAIFHPQWLRAEGIVPPEMADEATNVLVHPDLAHFVVREYEFEVTDEDLRISASGEAAGKGLANLLVGVASVLPHTPVWDVTVQRTRHFSVPALDSGSGNWGGLVWESLWRGVLSGSPTATEVVLRGDLPDDAPGESAVVIEPSPRLPGGLFLAYAEMRVLADPDSLPRGIPAGEAIPPLVEEMWAATWERAGTVLTELARRLMEPDRWGDEEVS